MQLATVTKLVLRLTSLFAAMLAFNIVAIFLKLVGWQSTRNESKGSAKPKNAIVVGDDTNFKARLKLL